MFIPCALLAFGLHALASTNEEFRLKHNIVALTPDERKRLGDLIEQRKNLAKERQGCDPISCLLLSIVCALCFLAYSHKNNKA